MWSSIEVRDSLVTFTQCEIERTNTFWLPAIRDGMEETVAYSFI